MIRHIYISKHHALSTNIHEHQVRSVIDRFLFIIKNYLHNHRGIFHDTSTWSELLDWAGRVQRSRAPAKQNTNETSKYLQTQTPSPFILNRTFTSFASHREDSRIYSKRFFPYSQRKQKTVHKQSNNTIFLL